MHRVMKQIHATDSEVRGLTGQGVTVAILDTGIGYHPDLTGKVLEYRDFVDGKISAYDDNDHGTHVAGIVSGSGQASNGYYRGVAPGSKLVIGKILNNKGEGTLNHMMEGIKWIIREKNHYHIRILNLSIGMAELEEDDQSKLLIELVEEASDSGIIVVAAAGNLGPNAMTLSSIGASRKVISVGCHDGDFKLKGFQSCETYSGRGPTPYSMKKPDIVAPGTGIISTNNKIKKRGDKYYNAYTIKSGTSMSTPIVAGATALLLENEPELSNIRAIQRLCAGSTDLHEPWNKQGHGMLNVAKTLA